MWRPYGSFMEINKCTATIHCFTASPFSLLPYLMLLTILLRHHRLATGTGPLAIYKLVGLHRITLPSRQNPIFRLYTNIGVVKLKEKNSRYKNNPHACMQLLSVKAMGNGHGRPLPYAYMLCPLQEEATRNRFLSWQTETQGRSRSKASVLF